MRLAVQRLAIAAVFVAFAHSASAQTADEIIEKSIAAMGGRAALDKLKTRQTTGTIAIGTPAGDISGTIEITNAAPNLQRTVIKADLTSVGGGQLLIDQRFDGATGYMLDSLQGDRPITGDQLNSMKYTSFPHPFLSYKALGTSVRFAGKEKVGERDAFVLAFTPTEGPSSRQFIDAETFLPAKAVMTMNLPGVGPLEQTWRVSDYRDADGMKLPHLIGVTSAVQGMTISVTKVQHNVPVDEKLFKKP